MRSPASLQAEFHIDLLHLLIAGNIAFHVVDRPYWRYFFQKYLPHLVLPGRKELSGRILEQEAQNVREKYAPLVRDRFATGQCDGWKNPAKASIIPKTAESLLEIVLNEIDYCVNVLKVNLVVGDIFKGKTFFVTVIDKALEVVKWFNNHTRALGYLKAAEMRQLRRQYSLILPVLTRWTSHYLCVTRLLEVRKAFRQLVEEEKEQLVVCAGTRSDAKRKAQEIIGILEDEQFWSCLQEAKLHLEPLAIAANICQSDYARLDVILTMLANLYRTFSLSAYDPIICNIVHNSLEKRWAKQDRDTFILALVLNPYVRATCFATNSPFRLPSILIKLATNAFRRFFNTEPDNDFVESFISYLRYDIHWSDEQMGLQRHSRRARDKGEDVNPIAIWRERLPLPDTSPSADITPSPPLNGAPGLANLAICVLSIVANSAPVERNFSTFGVIQSNLRNRLSNERVRDQAIIKDDLDKTFGSPAKDRKRRTFGEIEKSAQATAIPTSSQGGQSDLLDLFTVIDHEDGENRFLTIAQQLMSQAAPLDIFDGSTPPVENFSYLPLPTACAVSLPTADQHSSGTYQWSNSTELSRPDEDPNMLMYAAPPPPPPAASAFDPFYSAAPPNPAFHVPPTLNNPHSFQGASFSAENGYLQANVPNTIAGSASSQARSDALLQSNAAGSPVDEHYSLKNLFRYPSPHDAGAGSSTRILLEFWSAGEERLQQENREHEDIYSFVYGSRLAQPELPPQVA